MQGWRSFPHRSWEQFWKFPQVQNRYMSLRSKAEQTFRVSTLESVWFVVCYDNVMFTRILCKTAHAFFRISSLSLTSAHHHVPTLQICETRSGYHKLDLLYTYGKFWLIRFLPKCLYYIDGLKNLQMQVILSLIWSYCISAAVNSLTLMSWQWSVSLILAFHYRWIS